MTRRSTLFVMAFVLVFLIAPVWGQTNATPDDATPEQQLFRERVVLSFPQSIYFEMEILTDVDDIEELSLTLAEDTPSETVINFVDDEELDVFSDSVFASYVWVISSANPPDLFQEITYSWQGTIAGQSVSVEDAILFADDRVNWTVAESDDSRLRIAADAGIVRAGALVDRYAPVVELMQSRTGQSPNIQLLFHRPEQAPGCPIGDSDEPEIVTVVDYQYETVLCDTQLAEEIVNQSGYQLIVIDDSFNANDQLMPELIRAHYTALWQDVSVPSWFSYGLRAFYAPVADSTDLLTARQNLRSNNLLRLDEMDIVPINQADLMRWRAQAHGLVIYLADQYGVDAVFELARDVGEYEDFSVAYESITGDTLSALVPNWETWVFSDVAELAYGYVPYIGETPTLTATPTLTNTSPPPTVTQTPTETPDYTETPRPTRTQRPPTATITPLPAEGFTLRPTATMTPTPEPVGLPITEMLPGMSNTQVAILCGGIFLALLFVAIAMLSRQQSVSS